MAKLSDLSSPTRTTAHKISLGNEIDDVVRTLNKVLGTKALAAIVKKDPRTIQRWLHSKQMKVGLPEERVIRDVFQVYSILAVNDGDHTIRAWFMGMNPHLDDRSPIEVLIEGRPRYVVAAARSFASGA